MMQGKKSAQRKGSREGIPDMKGKRCAQTSRHANEKKKERKREITHENVHWCMKMVDPAEPDYSLKMETMRRRVVTDFNGSASHQDAC